MNYIYQNYHKHSERTNPIISDSTVTYKDYAEAAVKYGHSILSSAEHGYQGRYIETYDTAKDYKLKCLIGAEAYWVRNRLAPDNSNCHIWIGAKNENGRQAINDILSEANLTGFYFRPRVDVPLLLSLPKDDVWITTACVAYWKYEDIDSITKTLSTHFGKNFFLEVQYHNTESQKEINKHILTLHNKLKIPLIMGCDSHYISADQHQTREDFLLSKGIRYEDEEGWFLDYVDGQTAYNRFAAQNILSHTEITDAIANTNTFLDVEEYDSPVFNTDIKLPTLYDGEHEIDGVKLPKLDQQGRDEEYKKLVWQGWNEYKDKVPKEEWPKYEKEIQYEVDNVLECHMSDYFIDDYYIVKRGKELGGWLTLTGRGSGISYFTNKLLGFTEVDRVSAKVKMYPERFMTAERILSAGSLPDLDLNVADQEPFAQAQREILGEDHAYPMIAYGTYQKSAAWKLYAKAKGVPFETANAVSEQLKRYENAVKHADEEEKDDIDVLDYIDDQFKEIYEDSKDYMGLITSWSIAPCGFLLYQGSIRKEVGLIKIKDHLCCLMDGLWAEKNHFLKNDLLKVSVVDLIYRSYHRAGLEPPPQQELLSMLPPDDKAWNLYKTGCTLGLNQVEQPGTSSRVGKYAPTNISELCAFVAAIRPGFKSMYKTFETRDPFDYGVKQFDDLIQTDEMPNSFVLYQEHIMATLNYAGIPMSECYTAIKNIAKKRAEKVLAYKDTFISGFSEKIREEGVTEEDSKALAAKLWQIIDDSSSYSFNACLTGDTALRRTVGRFSKNQLSIKEMYDILHDSRYAKETGHKSLHDKYKRVGFGKALSLCEDGRIRENNIVDIRPAGLQMTYRITTSSGQTVDCTANHKFPTVFGEKRCDELKIGDVLYEIGTYEKDRTKYPFTDGNFESNVPVKGQMGFQKNPLGDSVLYYQFREEATAAKKACEDCGVEYTNEARFEVHHIDMDRTNNTYSNYAWLCCSCHKKRHYASGRRKRYEKGIPSLETTIISIEPLCEQETFDVEMAAPNHNFVLDNGLVVSNSHSYCVSLDSVYSAWIKAHHHLAFYETLLQIQEKKGNKDKMVEIKREAENYFGTSFPPYRFGQDNREIRANFETNEINNSIKAIKGLPKVTGDLLWTVAEQHPKSMTDTLFLCKQHKVSDAAIESLAKISFFSPFGNDVEISRIIELYHFFSEGTAKKIKKDKIENQDILKILSKYATDTNAKGEELSQWSITSPELQTAEAKIKAAKAKLKPYKDTDPPADLTDALESATQEEEQLRLTYEQQMLNEMEQYILSIGYDDLDFRGKMANQMDILGYVDLTTGREEDRRKLLIEDVQPMKDKKTGKPWCYRVDTRSIGSGKSARLSIPVNTYDETPIRKGDTIFTPQGSLKKNAKGYWYLYWYDMVYC